jgi:hypothetical protein
MCSNMSCLMFETTKSSMAQRALVWSWEVLSVAASALATDLGWYPTDYHHFLNDARRRSEADGDDVLRGFAKKSTLATGAERTEDSGMHTREV